MGGAVIWQTEVGGRGRVGHGSASERIRITGRTGQAVALSDCASAAAAARAAYDQRSSPYATAAASGGRPPHALPLAQEVVMCRRARRRGTARVQSSVGLPACGRFQQQKPDAGISRRRLPVSIKTESAMSQHGTPRQAARRRTAACFYAGGPWARRMSRGKAPTAAHEGIGRAALAAESAVTGRCDRGGRRVDECINRAETEFACDGHDHGRGARAGGCHPVRGAIRTRRMEIGNTGIAPSTRRGSPPRLCARHERPKSTAVAPCCRCHPEFRRAGCHGVKGCAMPPSRVPVLAQRRSEARPAW